MELQYQSGYEEVEENEIVISAVEPKENRKRVWIQKGKNLLRLDEYSSTQIGVTRTTKVSEMILNGTTDSVANIFSNVYLCTLKKGNYTFKVYSDDSLVTMQNDADCAFILRNLTSNTNISEKSLKWSDKTIKFTLTEESKIGLTMYANSTNIAFNNYNMKLMIVSRNEAKEYEEYIEQKIYIKNENDVYEEFMKKEVTTGTLEYNSNITSVDINNWTKIGNVVSVAFRGLVGNSMVNDSNLLILPFKPKSPGTPLLYIGERYVPNSVKFAYWSTTNIFKCAPIEAGEYVHIYFTYITNE